MRTTDEVLDHHLKCFAAQDLKGTLADYAADAVFFGIDGAVRGRDGIKAVFERLFSEFSKRGASIMSKHRLVEGDYAHLVWSAETPDNAYELASDTFVIQAGSIQMQAFTAKVRAKH